MAKYEYDPRRSFIVTIARDGAELSRRIVSACDPQDAIDEAAANLVHDHRIDLFNTTVEFRAEKA